VFVVYNTCLSSF